MSHTYFFSFGQICTRVDVFNFRDGNAAASDSANSRKEVKCRKYRRPQCRIGQSRMCVNWENDAAVVLKRTQRQLREHSAAVNCSVEFCAAVEARVERQLRAAAHRATQLLAASCCGAAFCEWHIWWWNLTMMMVLRMIRRIWELILWVMQLTLPSCILSMPNMDGRDDEEI